MSSDIMIFKAATKMPTKGSCNIASDLQVCQGGSDHDGGAPGIDILAQHFHPWNGSQLAGERVGVRVGKVTVV